MTVYKMAATSKSIFGGSFLYFFAQIESLFSVSLKSMLFESSTDLQQLIPC